jgi:helicase MOV-10
MEDAEKNKHGVTISQDLKFGIVDLMEAQRAVSVEFTMENNVPASRIVVVDHKLSVSTATSSPYVSRSIF